LKNHFLKLSVTDNGKVCPVNVNTIEKPFYPD